MLFTLFFSPIPPAPFSNGINQILMTVKSYIDRFRTIVDKVLRIGINDQESEIIRYAKYFTNTIAVLSASILFIYFLIYALKYRSSVSLLYLVIILLSVGTLVLNHFGLRRLASIYILSLNCALIFFTSLLGGFDMEIHPLLILVSFCSASTLLSWWLALLFNIALFTSYVIARSYSNEVGPWLDNPIMPNRGFVNFGFVLVSTFVVSRLILNNVLGYINRLQNALSAAKYNIDKVKKQNTRLEMFNTLAAHDLRTPTRQVISFVSLAKQSDNKEEIDGYLDMATKAGHRMNELVDAISTLKTIGQQEQKPINTIDLAAIISHIEQQEIEPQYGNIEIQYHSLPSINFRTQHLQLILSNLLSNAAKFNKKVKKIIQVSSQIDANHLFLSFADNGIGIEDRFKALVFQPFKKLHIHEVYAGAGLGLYIVSEILNFYDGSITLSNNEIGGSTFTIKLPVAVLSE